MQALFCLGFSERFLNRVASLAQGSIREETQHAGQRVAPASPLAEKLGLWPTPGRGADRGQRTPGRLALRTRAHGHYRRVATAILHGHQGFNQPRIAGRWHGHLFISGPVQILVQIQQDHHWTTKKTIPLTVRHICGQG
jgi:hypothetical protein